MVGVCQEATRARGGHQKKKEKKEKK